MIEGGGGAGFAGELALEFLVMPDVGGQEFEGDETVELGVERFVDDAHAAGAEHLVNLVMGNGEAGETDAGGGGLLGRGEIAEHFDGGAIQNFAFRILLQEPFDLAAEVGVGAFQHGGTAFSGGMVEFFDSLPTFRRHEHPVIRRMFPSL